MINGGIEMELKKNEEVLEELKENKSMTYFIVKRIMDIVLSMLALVFLSPFLLIIAIKIKLDSKGKVIFSQLRVGQNGKEFRMYKFRSMVTNAEEVLHLFKHKNEMDGPMFKIKDDPRVTKFGKFIRRTSIDELPQLINVLKGEMSLVGPRPNLPNEVAMFNEYQKQKLIAKPGLTCYWQVIGRSSIGFDDWMKLDIKYIEDRNILVDIKLILKTVKVLFGDCNAS